MKKLIAVMFLGLCLGNIQSVYAGCDREDVVCTDGSNAMTGTLKLKGVSITNTGTTGLVIDDGGYGWTIKSNGTTKLSVNAAGDLSTGSKICSYWPATDIETGKTTAANITPTGATGIATIIPPWGGSIVGLSVTVSNAVTAGEFTATVTTLKSGAVASAGLSVTVHSTVQGGFRNWITTATGSKTFSVGEPLGIQYTSSDSPALAGLVGKRVYIELCISQ